MITPDTTPIRASNMSMRTKCQCGHSLEYRADGLSTRAGSVPEGYKKSCCNLTCKNCGKKHKLFILSRN